MREREHERGVGIRADRQPLGARRVVEIVAQRRHVDELDARRGEPFQRGPRFVLARAAAVHLRVLGRNAAERDEQLAVLLELHPRGLLRAHRVHVHEDARQQGARGAEAVSAEVRDVAADRSS